MTVFRWAVGGLFALLALLWIVSFAIGIAFDNAVWHGRARRLRHWIYVLGLFWFNLEIWGRVLWTLVHWNG